jgi:hypothetical protein
MFLKVSNRVSVYALLFTKSFENKMSKTELDITKKSFMKYRY